ncbi:MAG: cytochrome c oxidase assembly factor Coa1 family protein [Phycisphaeraceae bacterium]
MSQHPSDMEMSQAYAPRPPKQKGWFARNWFWFIPLVVLLPILCCCGGGAWLVSFGVGEIMDTGAYKDTLADMENNPEVQQAIGTPIDAPDGFMDIVAMEEQGGTINLTGTGSQLIFDARVPVSGPSGSGTLIIDAESNDGGNTWAYKDRYLEVDGTGDIIDLMPNAP